MNYCRAPQRLQRHRRGATVTLCTLLAAPKFHSVKVMSVQCTLLKSGRKSLIIPYFLMFSFICIFIYLHIHKIIECGTSSSWGDHAAPRLVGKSFWCVSCTNHFWRVWSILIHKSNNWLEQSITTNSTKLLLNKTNGEKSG